MNMKVKDGLGLAIIWVQQALILACEDNCPLRPVETGRYSLKRTSELESLIKGVRRLFNMWQTDKNPQSWELYREAQQRCRKEVRKASKDAWRTFCSSINDLPMTTRLHRALSRDPKSKLGSLVEPSGRHTQSEGETLEHFLATHFPNLVVTEEAANVAACCAKCLDWWVAARVVTYTRVEWAIDSCAPYKSPGMAGIFPALLQEGQRIWVPYLVKIFHACLATGYIPAIWRQVKEAFISKPGMNSYSGPRDFRPISLTSFLHKTMERLVDRFLRNEIFVFMPLHPNQHAYQARKSVEMGLHQLFVWVGKVPDHRETALGVFLDTEGAFNNTSYDSICAALFKHGVKYTILRWIRATLEGDLAATTLSRSSRSIEVSRGCPQGGVLLPLQWYLAVDDLIARRNVGGVYTQGYMDGISLLVVRKFPNTVAGLIQWALHIAETWYDEVGLSVNLDKTGFVFT